jgi:hypothetical protein
VDDLISLPTIQSSNDTSLQPLSPSISLQEVTQRASVISSDHSTYSPPYKSPSFDVSPESAQRMGQQSREGLYTNKDENENEERMANNLIEQERKKLEFVNIIVVV